MDLTNQTDGKRYLYGVADEKFVKAKSRKTKKPALASFKFRLYTQLLGKSGVQEFNKIDVPLVFKCRPDTLVNLCLQVLDALPLPKVYEWSIEDICKWLRDNGFKQYQNTFRANLITGRKLLLLDAAALAAMNIKDFDHIKKITRDIRHLFNYEMTKFGRCLTLYPEFHEELFKLIRLKTGAKYDVRRSEVWRKMQLIRQKEPNYMHWDILEQWLGFDKNSPFRELIGGARRHNLYACKTEPLKHAVIEKHYHCTCLPPCECYSRELNYRRPWHLKCLPHLKPDSEFVASCGGCCPPCNCRWASKSYQIHGVLSCLKRTYPNKYDGNFALLRHRKYDQISFSFFPQI